MKNKRTLIHNATIINENKRFIGSVVIEDNYIAEVLTAGQEPKLPCSEVIDATGNFLIPGVIDTHVHFRDPGMTQKADFLTESSAAVAGGVTSICDMPNTIPQTTTIEALESKLNLMSERSLINYSCFFGATNSNFKIFKDIEQYPICGIKVFMGASTGNMLVDRRRSLEEIFNGTDFLIATHCENNDAINKNRAYYLKKENEKEDLPLSFHPLIRSEEACYQSTALAVELATQTQARLHVLHLSTKKELQLFSSTPIEQKSITSEACIGHLLYSDKDYLTLGTKIKCNPAIKTEEDKKGLRDGINTNLIDTIATDHAPHLPKDKEGGALKAASGIPTLQYSLVNMLQLVDEGVFSLETIVDKMCHAPAKIFRVKKRGFIKKGYAADLVLLNPKKEWCVTKENILSKCGWSPFEGNRYNWSVEKTFVNGNLLYSQNRVVNTQKGELLDFDR
ncbi:MAG: dihydroorotase [Bacteroidales bacterium]|nr:dihydroorotase [Bacteroidales bacterium]